MMQLQGHRPSPSRQARHALGGVLLSALAFVLCGAPAHAADAAPKWAVLPLVVVGGEGKEAKQYQSAYESEVSKSGMDRASPKQVAAFLAKEPSCPRTDECMARLAAAVGADRTLLVTLSPFAKEMILTSKVVGVKGNVLHESASTPGREKKSAIASAREAFAELLSDLQTEIVPLAPVAQGPKTTPPPKEQPKTPPSTTTQGQGTTSTAQAQTSTKTPPATGPVATAVPKQPVLTPSAPPAPAGPGFFASRTWKTPAAIGLGVVGVGGIVGGLMFYRKAQADYDQLDARYAAFPHAPGSPYPSQENVKTLYYLADDARLKSTLEWVSIGVGAAAIAGGVTLFVLDKPSSGPKVSMSVSVTPSSATLTFQLP